MPKMKNIIAEYDKHIEKLEAENKKYKTALKAIKKHHEIISPSSCWMSTVYKIVTKALNGKV